MAASPRLTRSRWAAIGAAIAVTLGGGGLIGVSASGKGASDPTLSSGFTAVSPVRILDTRSGTKPSGNTTFVQVTGSITLASGATSTVVPAGASTVSMNLTVTEGVRNQGYGFVTAYPCSSAAAPAPNASSINFVEGTDVANGLSVPLGDTGGLCLNVYGSAHLIIDVNGYFDQIDSYALNRRNLPTGVITIDAGTVAAEVGQHSAVVYRDDGTPFIAYSRQDDYALMGASCADPACTDITFSGRLFPAAGGVVSMDMTLGADGNPIIVYDAEDADGVQVVACSDPSCAFALSNDIATPGGGTDPSIAISTDGRPVIASGGGGIWVTVCEDDLCIDNETTEIIDSGNGFASDTDIMIGPKGQVYVVGDSNGELILGVCDDTAPLCSNPSVNSANGAITDINAPVIATSPAGIPVIAYADDTNNQIEIASCTTIDCVATDAGSAVFPLVDPVNAELAMVIGPNGAPTVIAHDVDVLVGGACLTIDCSVGTNDPVTLASGAPGDPVGLGIAIGIGLDGVPLITYHDGDTGLVSERLFWMAHSN